MKQTKAQKIVIIGCGNLSWHLALKLKELKKFDLYVYNHRASEQLNEFSTKLKCRTFDSLDNIIEDASFYLLCVPDRMISQVSQSIKTKGIVMHCSGSKSITDINAENKGVLYPLQTFSKRDKIEWNNIPLFIEANTKSAERHIKLFAENLSERIIQANTEERIKIHLAAVIVNNFTNALYTAAGDFLSQSEKFKFDLLLPLIQQTVKKLEKLSPRDAQTGPAKRGDDEVIEKHLSLLKNNKRLKKNYKQLSKLIEQQQATNA